MIPVSVIVLTKNEEQDIVGCLESVSWSDDIHVLDSGSTDRTVELARQLGAEVSVRPFDNYASQGNVGLHSIAHKHEWVLILDADERVSIEFRNEIAAFVVDPPAGVAAGRVRRRDYFMGRWLKHVQASPFYIRLVRPNSVRYERPINPVLRVDGEIHDMGGWIDHYPFSKGLSHWVDKHNQYSTMESGVILSGGQTREPISLKSLLARDFNKRREAQKALFYRLPGRPVIKFLLLYVIKGGFLDGRPGFAYATLQSFYEYLIILKTREAIFNRSVRRNQPSAATPESE